MFHNLAKRNLCIQNSYFYFSVKSFSIGGGGRGGSLEGSAMGILVVRLWACELQLGGKGTTDECAN